MILAASGVIAAADAPYIGKWKSNPAKSDFKGTTVTYSQTPAGQMQFSTAGVSYSFKTDGTEYPALFGSTATWKQIDSHTFATVQKYQGKVISTDTVKVSSDGKTMTVHSKGTKPNGDAFETTLTYQRASGSGSGLAGTWKTAQVKTEGNLLTIEPNGDDGITLGITEYKAVCKAKFDSKDYPAVGPQIPPGFTLALRKTGDRSFEMLEKIDGKPFYKLDFTVSADGKTLTESGAAVATNEKVKIVYDRQ
jgi:hypothetical protein